MLEQLKKELKELADPERAGHDDRFFKTGKGEYGEGRISLGIKTEDKRRLAKEHYQEISLKDIGELLNSGISDYQFIALVMLVHKYRKDEQKKEIINLYLKNTDYINNWDLVDISAYNILGDFLVGKDKSILYELAQSNNLWEKRIAIISTFAFIRQEKFDDTLAISEILLGDEHDLIHKAVGWMLREVGKRNVGILEDFLKQHYKDMPRTMLRYAIEKFEEDKRKMYLGGRFEMDDELLKIINLLKKTLPRLLENPRIMTGCDVSEEEIKEIESRNLLSLGVLEHLSGDMFFELYYKEIGVNKKEAQEVAKFLKSSAKHFLEELKKDLPYLIE